MFMLATVAGQQARLDAEGARRKLNSYTTSIEGCRYGASGKTLVRFGPGASVASISPLTPAEKRARAAERAGAFAAGLGADAPFRVFSRSGGVAATLNTSMLDVAMHDPDVRRCNPPSPPPAPHALTRLCLP